MSSGDVLFYKLYDRLMYRVFNVILLVFIVELFFIFWYFLFFDFILLKIL